MEENLRPAAATAHPAFLTLRNPPREAVERPWGSWTVLHDAPGVKVKLIEVNPGHRLSLQYHHHRSELWTCVSGRASAQIGDTVLELEPRCSAEIPLGAVHRLGNLGTEPVFIVEVQLGEILEEDDIVRLEDDYRRASSPIR